MRKDKAGRKKENRYISGGHEGTDCQDTFKKHLRKASESNFIISEAAVFGDKRADGKLTARHEGTDCQDILKSIYGKQQKRT